MNKHGTIIKPVYRTDINSLIENEMKCTALNAEM